MESKPVQPGYLSLSAGQIIARIMIALLAALLICLIGVYLILRPAPNKNALAIGDLAAVDLYDLTVYKPVELDFLSKEEVYAIRSEAVNLHPVLLAAPYRPSDQVFGQIVSGLPWWGLIGDRYYDSSGEHSIEGLSEEARYIRNPYLLVAADFGALWYGNRWDPAKVTAETAGQGNFPLYCAPGHLVWAPGERRAEVTYWIGSCIGQINQYTTQPVTLNQAFFHLYAYNARDLNLNYAYVSYADSFNISHSTAVHEPFAIRHFLHQGGSCGYPGGCNNMSPATPELDNLKLDGLPAQVVIWLWHKNPRSLEQSPDMVFIIHFE